MNTTARKKMEEKDTEARKLIAEIRPKLNNLDPAEAGKAAEHIQKCLTEEQKKLEEEKKIARASNGAKPKETTDPPSGSNLTPP
jgi:hypothetical protein